MRISRSIVSRGRPRAQYDSSERNRATDVQVDPLEIVVQLEAAGKLAPHRVTRTVASAVPDAMLASRV